MSWLPILALSAASLEEAEALEAALAPVLAEGALPALLDALRLLRLLRGRGAGVQAPWEGLLLETALALVAGSAAARASLAGPDPAQCGLVVRTAA